MAKPIDLYQGGAPSAMSQMGAGFTQAGANIANSLMQGAQNLGRGIEEAGQAYSQYSTAKASNDMMKTILNDRTLSEQILGIKADQEGDDKRKAMISSLSKMINQHGQFGAAKASMPMLGSFMQDAQLGREYANKIRLAQATAQAQSQYSPKAVRYSSFVDDGSLQPQQPQRVDPVTGSMDLNAQDQGGADQSLPLFGGQPKTGIVDWMDKKLTPKPFNP